MDDKTKLYERLNSDFEEIKPYFLQDLPKKPEGLRLLNKWVLIKPVEANLVSSGGIILTKSQNKDMEGVVYYKGDKVIDDIEVGHVVIFNDMLETVTFKKEKFYLLHQNHILAVVLYENA